MYAYNYYYQNDLYHHGIKGQKWGVRRFQNKDGSLTNAGRKRYSDEVNDLKTSMKSAEAKMKKAYSVYDDANSEYFYKSTKKNKERLQEAEQAYAIASRDYKSSKMKYKIAKMEADGGFIPDENKSKHRLMLEEKYRKQGYNEQEAAVMANDRIRTEKIVTAAAALTVTACAAYAANKYIKNRTDGIIKSGETLQRIEMQDTGGKLHDVFYTSKGKHDNTRYAGLLGMTRKQQTGQAYMMKLEANNDIKVASKEKAAQVFGELYKNDPEFKKSVEGHVRRHFSGRNIANVNNMSDKNIRKLYENFNSGLIHIRDDGSGADKKFYNKLKEAGYGAIQDINDMKYSGYKAKNPLIVFDNSNNNIMVKSVNEMKGDLIGKGMIEYGKASIETKFEKMMTSPAPALALSGAAASMYVGDRANSGRQKTDVVKQYKAEHPNTQLTDAQIKEIYEGGK